MKFYQVPRQKRKVRDKLKEHLQKGEIDVTKNIYLFTALEQELLGQNPANGLPQRKKKIKHSYKVKVG